MIELDVLEKELEAKKIKNSYIFCGADEMLIKENIDSVISNVINDSTFLDLNLIKIDGNTCSFEDIMNACETLPFMSDKKVVLVYRANFLKDKTDKSLSKVYDSIKAYLKDTPSYCTLIMYYLFNDKRERPNKNKKFAFLDKNSSVVFANKLRGEKYYKKVGSVFEKKGKKIGKVELRFFCDFVSNNFEVIDKEIEKLIAYTDGREITKNDIIKLLPNKSEDDIFDLVDSISQRRPEKAIDIMNDLLNKGENIMKILSLIATQFNMLFKIKVALNDKKRSDEIARDIRRPQFIAEKLIAQSHRFTFDGLKECMQEFLITERNLKATSQDKKTELELFIMKTVIVGAKH